MTSTRHTTRGTHPSTRLLSVKEAAELLAVTEPTIRHWIAEGMVPCIELPSQSRHRRYRIPLQGLLNARTVGDSPAYALERLDDAGDRLNEGMHAALRRGQRRASSRCAPAPPRTGRAQGAEITRRADA
jgi:excisionase family DNA binding protein